MNSNNKENKCECDHCHCQTGNPSEEAEKLTNWWGVAMALLILCGLVWYIVVIKVD